ncbi:hypothetical protein BDW22DRAFT_343822 [Trametopsis cervina]|nr:hypothetical protein BDW22DRAFT_343822 [Trametopsis cervina]
MGVPGLWATLREAGVPRSLTDIAVTDGFLAANPPHGAASHPRAFRIGIDASIWFVHAEYGKEGENPELRTIFFRLTKLLQVPFLPLFVFDGPLRPEMKRGKLIDMKPSWMVEGLKTMIDAFGFEWRTAPGEAEAELAYLNQIGVIDAVLTDDVDTLVFGATLVIRNQSKNLTGNRAHDLNNADGRDDKNHTMTFAAEDIRSNPKVNLTQEGLILIALLSGGDYSKGVEGCGPQVAACLAQCGFGESLVNKIRSLSLSITLGLQTNGPSGSRKASKTRVTLGTAEQAELMRWLKTWREEVCLELRTNSRGFMKKKSPSLAAKILQSNWVPDIQVLMAYINPVTSEERAIANALMRLFEDSPREATPRFEVDQTVANAKREVAADLRSKIVWAQDPDIAAIARVCEDRFEWGVKDIIIKRFRSWLWSGIVCRMLRRGTIHIDNSSSRSATPIGSQRTVTAARLESLVMSSPRKGRPRRPLHNGDSSDEDSDKKDRIVVKIHSSRNHASTDGLLEYRLEVDPSSFVKAVEDGIEGKREMPKTGWTDSEGEADDDDDAPKKGKKTPAAAPTDHLRMWMPASIVRIVLPDMVQLFEDKTAKRAKSKHGTNPTTKRQASIPKSKTPAVRASSEYDSEDSVPLPTTKAKAGRVVVTRVASVKPVPPIDEYDDQEIHNTTRPSIRTVNPKPETMSDFFKASKPGMSSSKAQKSGTATSSSSTARVASLFNDPEIQIFRDLTTRSEKPVRSKSSKSVLNVPTATRRLPAPQPINGMSKQVVKQATRSDYIEISSDSDVPLPRTVTATKPHPRPTLRRPEADSIIDLCSD